NDGSRAGHGGCHHRHRSGAGRRPDRFLGSVTASGEPRCAPLPAAQLSSAVRSICWSCFGSARTSISTILPWAKVKPHHGQRLSTWEPTRSASQSCSLIGHIPLLRAVL